MPPLGEDQPGPSVAGAAGSDRDDDGGGPGGGVDVERDEVGAHHPRNRAHGLGVVVHARRQRRVRADAARVAGQGDGDARIPDAVHVPGDVCRLRDRRREDVEVVVAQRLELGDRLGECVGDGPGGLAEGIDFGRVAAELHGPFDAGPVRHHAPGRAVVDPDRAAVVSLDGTVAVGVGFECGDDLLQRGPGGAELLRVGPGRMALDVLLEGLADLDAVDGGDQGFGLGPPSGLFRSRFRGRQPIPLISIFRLIDLRRLYRCASGRRGASPPLGIIGYK